MMEALSTVNMAYGVTDRHALADETSYFDGSGGDLGNDHGHVDSSSEDDSAASGTTLAESTLYQVLFAHKLWREEMGSPNDTPLADDASYDFDMSGGFDCYDGGDAGSENGSGSDNSDNSDSSGSDSSGSEDSGGSALPTPTHERRSTRDQARELFSKAKPYLAAQYVACQAVPSGRCIAVGCDAVGAVWCHVCHALACKPCHAGRHVWEHMSHHFAECVDQGFWQPYELDLRATPKAAPVDDQRAARPGHLWPRRAPSFPCTACKRAAWVLRETTFGRPVRVVASGECVPRSVRCIVAPVLAWTHRVGGTQRASTNVTITTASTGRRNNFIVSKRKVACGACGEELSDHLWGATLDLRLWWPVTLRHTETVVSTRFLDRACHSACAGISLNTALRVERNTRLPRHKVPYAPTRDVALLARRARWLAWLTESHGVVCALGPQPHRDERAARLAPRDTLGICLAAYAAVVTFTLQDIQCHAVAGCHACPQYAPAAQCFAQA